jgi:hypothetical protein
VEPGQPRVGESTPAGSTGGGHRKLCNIVDFGEITVDMLRATFPQWHLFRVRGLWWALRGGLERTEGPESLLLRVVSASTLNALAEKLCLQDYLDRLDPDQLVAVYRDMALPETTAG